MYAPNAQSCCETCRHFRPIAASTEGDEEYTSKSPIEEGEYGKCTRYPPVFFYPRLLNAEFPVVRRDEVCGEYARAPY